VSAKDRVRGAVPSWALVALRRASRLRWAAKAGTLRRYGFPVRKRPLEAVRYVLLDPEVGDFSYELRNEDEFARGLADALGVPVERIRESFAEVRASPALTSDLRRRTRWRPDMKRHIAFGPRLGWYAIVRELKPSVVVETGIKHGFGSLVLLEALRRNALEGHDGRLLSADLDPAAGWVVPSDLAGRWTKLVGKADEVVAGALDGHRIDVLIHDTPPLPEIEHAEYGVALAHRAPRVLLVSGSNGDQTGVLPGIAAEHSAPYHLIREIPDHIYPGQGVGLVLLDDDA
jgi:hypothetical protein